LVVGQSNRLELPESFLSPRYGEVAPRGNFSQQVGGDNVPLLGLGASGGVNANPSNHQVGGIGSQVGELGNEVVEQKFAVFIGEPWSKPNCVGDGEREHIRSIHFFIRSKVRVKLICFYR
jgi:hypothetical protein